MRTNGFNRLIFNKLTSIKEIVGREVFLVAFDLKSGVGVQGSSYYTCFLTDAENGNPYIVNVGGMAISEILDDIEMLSLTEPIKVIFTEHISSKGFKYRRVSIC